MDYKIVLLLAATAMLCSGNPNPPVKYPPCACGKIYFPLCGSDGVTYDNICEFNCRADSLWEKEKIRLEVVKEDACDAPVEVLEYV